MRSLDMPDERARLRRQCSCMSRANFRLSPATQRSPNLLAELDDRVEIPDHVVVAGFGLRLLIRQQGGRAAGIAGEKQQEVVLEVVQPLVRQCER